MANKYLLISILFFSLPSFANHYDISVAGGVAFSKLSNNSTVGINSSVVNGYDTDEELVGAPLAKLGFGYTFENIWRKPINIAINLAGYYVGFNQVEGIEHPLVNIGQFDTLDYQFSAESFAAMLESRFYFTQSAWHPFILLGVGESWNHLYGYSETPSNPNGTAAAAPEVFKNHTHASFAYEAGIGVQRLLFEDTKYHVQWFMSLDYRYMSLGKGNLATSDIQTTGETLTVSHLNTNALVFTIDASI